jgi:hypothetical protein
VQQLKDMGYEVSGSRQYKTALLNGKGMSFDFDDPEEQGKVGLRLVS